MQNDQIRCKKCGELHGTDVWRGVEFYDCPRDNRILLLNKLDSLKNQTKEVTNEQHEDGVGTA